MQLPQYTHAESGSGTSFSVETCASNPRPAIAMTKLCCHCSPHVDALVAEDALGVVAHVEVVVDLHRLGDGRRSVAVAADVDAVLVVPVRHVLRERQVDR